MSEFKVDLDEKSDVSDSNSERENETEEVEEQDDLNIDEPIFEEIEGHNKLSRDGLGLDAPNWLSFLRGFKSSKEYSDRVIDFLKWHKQNDFPQNIPLTQSLNNYFDFASGLQNTKDPSKPKYAPTTLNSWFSMLEKFFLYAWDLELKQTNKVLLDNIKKWKNGYKPRKSKTMTKENLIRFLELPNDSKTLPEKVN